MVAVYRGDRRMQVRGHLELFGRRYRQGKTAANRVQLRLMIEHTMLREFGGAVPSLSTDRDPEDLPVRILRVDICRGNGRVQARTSVGRGGWEAAVFAKGMGGFR